MRATTFAAVIILLGTLTYLYGFYKASYEEAQAALQVCRVELETVKGELARYKALSPRPQGIHVPHLRALIDSTLQYLGVRGKGWKKLLLLTALHESKAGAYTRQLRGPAQGLMQIEPETEHSALVWSAHNRPALFNRLKSLRCQAKLSIHEMQYNHAYAIGIAYTVYLMRKANPEKENTEGLARLYKKHFNTYKGKATIKGVLNSVSSFVTSL